MFNILNLKAMSIRIFINLLIIALAQDYVSLIDPYQDIWIDGNQNIVPIPASDDEFNTFPVTNSYTISGWFVYGYPNGTKQCINVKSGSYCYA